MTEQTERKPSASWAVMAQRDLVRMASFGCRLMRTEGTQHYRDPEMTRSAAEHSARVWAWQHSHEAEGGRL